MRSWSDRISVLISRHQSTCSLFPSLSFSLSLSLPCEYTARREPSIGQEESSHQEPNGLASWAGISSLQSCAKLNACCLSSPVYGILLWQPEQTTTAIYQSIQYSYLRRDPVAWNKGWVLLYVKVNMSNGQLINSWVDSLRAYFPKLWSSKLPPASTLFTMLYRKDTEPFLRSLTGISRPLMFSSICWDQNQWSLHNTSVRHPRILSIFLWAWFSTESGKVHKSPMWVCSTTLWQKQIKEEVDFTCKEMRLREVI